MRLFLDVISPGEALLRSGVLPIALVVILVAVVVAIVVHRKRKK